MFFFKKVHPEFILRVMDIELNTYYKLFDM
jgi:hypothetical protein